VRFHLAGQTFGVVIIKVRVQGKCLTKVPVTRQTKHEPKRGTIGTSTASTTSSSHPGDAIAEQLAEMVEMRMPSECCRHGPPNVKK